MGNGSQTNTRSQGFWAGLLCRIKPTLINLQFREDRKFVDQMSAFSGRLQFHGIILISILIKLQLLAHIGFNLRLPSYKRSYSILCLNSVPSRLSICNSTSSSRLPSFTYVLTRVFKPLSLNYLRKFVILTQLRTLYYTPKISGRTLHDFFYHKISVH